jgi:type III secretion protein C
VRLNAVVIRDTRRNLALYEDIIGQLDVPVAIIEINAAIIDLNATAARTLGADWLLRKTGANGYAQAGMDTGRVTAGTFGPGSPASQDATLAPGIGGSLSSLVTWDGFELLARFQALEEKGEARILSRPSVLTLDNVEAVLRNDQTFYVRVAGDQEVDLFNVSAGTTLQVTPHLIETPDQDRKIKLVVNISDGAVTAETVDGIPVINDSRINTQATILENQSLLVGGYTREADSTTRRATPWLSRIPLLGTLFRKDSRNREKRERLFLITPRVVSLAYEKNVDVTRIFHDLKTTGAADADAADLKDRLPEKPTAKPTAKPTEAPPPPTPEQQQEATP